MAYINKIVVNGQEVNANQLEGILDKNGHQRFIEDTPTLAQLIEDIVVYAKWSLSGSHLMLVLAMYNNSGASITVPQYAEFCSFVSLPDWVKAKILPTNPNANILGDVAGVSNVKCTKASSDGNVKFVAFENFTIADGGAVRMQFDLLIDNE